MKDATNVPEKWKSFEHELCISVCTTIYVCLHQLTHREQWKIPKYQRGMLTRWNKNFIVRELL